MGASEWVGWINALSPVARSFSRFGSDGGTITHPPDPAYNCLAWAAGITDAIWWPADPDAIWPVGVTNELTISAIAEALATAGYTTCADGDYEVGFEKAAIYAKGDIPTHVARQLVGGLWSSKLGRDYTVSHNTPHGVAGVVYGVVVLYLRRRKS